MFRAFRGGSDAWRGPTAQVLHFPIDVAYPTEIGGRPMRTYIDWLASCYHVTLTGHPALSLPAGFARDGDATLPVGLQLVGHWGRDEALLDVAETVESLLAPRLQAQRPTPCG